MASAEPVAGAAMTMADARARVGDSVHVVGVIGSPVAHSLSPLLHTAAFAAMGLAATWRSFAFEIPAGEAGPALEAMRASGVSGLSVTMPHKSDVATLVDECSATARRLGAVNCVQSRADGTVFGTNTDGEGFVASLARAAELDPRGRRCVVIGAGGAARAIVLALAGAGAAQVAIVNRTPQRAIGAADLAGPRGRALPATGPEVLDAVGAADLIVNATPLGMAGVSRPDVDGDPEWLVDPALLHPGQVAVDLVYAPRRTPWLAGALAAGATILDGLGMLVHQAAAQLALWTGQEPPVEAMWEAAERVSPPPA